MHIESKTLAFTDFRHLLAQADSLANPAEIHGIICGLVCTGQKLDGQAWFHLVLKLFESRAHITALHRGLVLDLYEKTCLQLSGLENDFYLLLPDNEQPLAERAEALSQWCQGFLYSLRLINSSIQEEAPKEILEALNTIQEIAKLDYSNIIIRDVDTNAYTGVVEFVRKAVISLHEDFSYPKTKSNDKKDPIQLH
jgi:yecA family protein